MSSPRNGDQSDRIPLVVLLGAGASKNAGLPLATELTLHLQSELDNRGDRRLLEALGLILGALAFRNGIRGVSTSVTHDIEAVLRVAQQLSKRNDQPLSTFVGSWHPALEQLAPNGEGVVFESLVSTAYEVLKDRLQTPDKPTKFKYLADVWDLTRAFDSDEPPPVFSLNYDLLVEEALKHKGKEFTTGFLNGLWTPSQFKVDGTLKLYKLHGSIGWVRDRLTSLLYDREAALNRDDVSFESPDTPDELIFGTDNKLKAVNPFLWMFYAFDDAVSRADFIVTIGYGFGDEHVNQIISQGLARDEAKRLLVVGPGLNMDKLDIAPGMSTMPTRTHFIEHDAKKALTDEESIRSTLTDLRTQASTEDPFLEESSVQEESLSGDTPIQ